MYVKYIRFIQKSALAAERGEEELCMWQGLFVFHQSVARLSACIAGSQKEDKFFGGGTGQGNGFVCSPVR